MQLSIIALILFVFLQSANLLGWFAVSATFLGIVGIVFCVLALVEGLGFFSHPLSVRRRAD